MFFILRLSHRMPCAPLFIVRIINLVGVTFLVYHSDHGIRLLCPIASRMPYGHKSFHPAVILVCFLEIQLSRQSSILSWEPPPTYDGNPWVTTTTVEPYYIPPSPATTLVTAGSTSSATATTTSTSTTTTTVTTTTRTVTSFACPPCRCHSVRPCKRLATTTVPYITKVPCTSDFGREIGSEESVEFSTQLGPLATVLSSPPE